MTVRELIEELKKYPKSTTIMSDDGTGWASKEIYLDYDKSENTLGIYAK